KRVRRQHAALGAGEAAGTAEARRPAWFGTVRGNILGRGACHRHRLAGRGAASRPKEAGLLYGAGSVAIADRILGAAIRYAQLRRTWRLLLGEHGRCRDHDHRWRLLGIRSAGLGTDEAVHSF